MVPGLGVSGSFEGKSMKEKDFPAPRRLPPRSSLEYHMESPVHMPTGHKV